MNREHWAGTTSFQQDGTSDEGTITIQWIKSSRNLVTIEGLGQGNVAFSHDGSFQGCWAMDNEIYDVSGRAEGDRANWIGRFEIRRVDGHIVVNGKFRVENTRD